MRRTPPAAHNRRPCAVVGELHGAHDRLRLADRVVIEQQRVVSRTWEGYYLYRNHWICSLLHCTKPSWHFLYGMLFDDAKAGVELVYSAMHLHHLALRDIMRGPDYIADTLATKLGDVRKAREGFPDSATTRNRDDFPQLVRRILEDLGPRLEARHIGVLVFLGQAFPTDPLARRVLARIRGREFRGRDVSGR